LLNLDVVSKIIDLTGTGIRQIKVPKTLVIHMLKTPVMTKMVTKIMNGITGIMKMITRIAIKENTVTEGIVVMMITGGMNPIIRGTITMKEGKITGTGITEAVLGLK
jgi:hypothetical protein